MTTKLETLGKYVYDSIEGYRRAQEKANDPGLRSAFADRLTKREQTLSRINAELASHKGDPIHSGSAKGSLHQAWVNLTDALDSGDEAIVERVEEGEDFLKDKFKDALDDDDLTSGERTTIAACYDEISSGEKMTDRLEDRT